MAHAAFLVFGAILVAGVALSTPGITREDPGEAATPAGAEANISASPAFTPFTVRPGIINRDEVRAALEREYPPLLRDAGIGGTVRTWFFIDEEGVVKNQVVANTSGHEALDQAALRVAPLIKFTPALNRDQVVPAWLELPITFTTK